MELGDSKGQTPRSEVKVTGMSLGSRSLEDETGSQREETSDKVGIF